MDNLITIDKLVALGATTANATKYCPFLVDAAEKFNINTKARVKAFLSQVYEETGGLSLSGKTESLNYSAKALLAQWPNRFSHDVAYRLGRADGSTTPVSLANQQAIANIAYGTRGGNIAGSMDGWNYRGRGFLQITFKDNYRDCGNALGIDLVAHPELLEQDKWAAESAGWYWNKYGCNQLADADTLDALYKVTRVVNGGLGNLDKRIAYWEKANKIWN